MSTTNIPILTEIIDDDPLNLPTLTEALNEHALIAHHPIPLDQAQCEQLAQMLLPELTQFLREQLSAQPEAYLQTLSQALSDKLPQLIYATTQSATEKTE